MAATPNLQRKLQQTLGAEAASDLGAWMQSMDAHRTDTGDLRREMQAGFARIDGRLDTMQERFEKLLEKGLREQTRFFFLAWSVLLTAMIGLYAPS
jgi:hypothetical protein